MAQQTCATILHALQYIYVIYASMVPGNLPSQLEIMSTGQAYYRFTEQKSDP